MTIERPGQDGLAVDTNRRLAVRWMNEVWNERNDAAVDEILAPDVIGHMEGGNIQSPAEFRAVRDQLLSAFPDLRVRVEEVIAEGDTAALRWSVTATHTGEGLGFAPSNSEAVFRGISWMRFREGKVVEAWDSWNQGGLLQSLRLAVK